MGLRGQNKTTIPTEETVPKETPQEEKVVTKEVTTKTTAPPPVAKSGTVSMCIQDPVIVASVAEDTDMPLIFAKDGTHWVAGKKPQEFGKEFEYFPILVSSYWVMDPGYDLGEEVYEEFKKFADDGDNVPRDAKNKVDKEGILDREGVKLGDTMAAAVADGHDGASIKRYVTIKCLVTTHEGKFDLDPFYDVVALRLAPGSQWGIGGYETMIKGLNKAIAFGRLKGSEFKDESVVSFKATAETTSYGDGPTYTRSVVKPA